LQFTTQIRELTSINHHLELLTPTGIKQLHRPPPASLSLAAALNKRPASLLITLTPPLPTSHEPKLHRRVQGAATIEPSSSPSHHRRPSLLFDLSVQNRKEKEEKRNRKEKEEKRTRAELKKKEETGRTGKE
jgi:hypothetical protein